MKGGSSEFAYRALRDEIVSLSLEPGADLDEATVVTRLGLSRTPVREALVRLAGEGLVQLLPNRGARVSPMGWNDIREHLEAFDVAQRLVTRWAAIRRTESQLVSIRQECEAFEKVAGKRMADQMLESNWRFHAAIAACCRNKVLEQFYLQLLTGNLRISRLAMAYQAYPSEEAYRSHVGNILREHREIVDAIESGDADRAEALARSHAGLARKRVSETLTQSLTTKMDISLGGQSDAA
ncbi:GntR family transcriptional regulator [Mesorhizobium sp. J428]|uniref:GntR family transcriptional regulator n=1 Tax=Mesorhizobium sp. J428 TaxID=2898440 RepID=UPI0021517236|nr:GntR family transcriptional regulator [Mesorhizobium sp. J428]MCR5857206.1 GntR family transcriptional regulator [Mesorhizobium sp. J428]